MPDETNPKLKIIQAISTRLALPLAILVPLFIAGAIYLDSTKNTRFISAPLVAFVCGVIGGFVGLQRRLKGMSDDDLTLLKDSWVYICLSPLVGGILAVITYVLFISGLLAGDLFPSFTKDAGANENEGLRVIFEIHGSAADYGKMIFWSFIAGFSERFVTDIISRFESQAAPEKKPGTTAPGSTAEHRQ
jgi:hypothetical protein